MTSWVRLGYSVGMEGEVMTATAKIRIPAELLAAGRRLAMERYEGNLSQLVRALIAEAARSNTTPCSKCGAPGIGSGYCAACRAKEGA